MGESVNTQQSHPAPAGRPPGASDQQAPNPRDKKKSISLTRILVLLVLLGGLGYLGLTVMEQQMSVEALFSQQNRLFEDTTSSSDSISTLRGRLEVLEYRLDEAESELAEANQGISQQRAEYRDRLARLNEDLIDTRLGLNATVSGANQAWLLGEAESLVRLARQRLAVARDVGSAIALLSATDNILARVNDPAVMAIQGEIAADLARLRQVPEVDVRQVWLDLRALADGVESQEFVSIARPRGEPFTLSAAVPPGEEPQWWDRVLARLEDYITVRRLDQPVQPPLSGEDRYYIRQDILLSLEQAGLALLRAEAEIYRANIARAREEVTEYMLEEAPRKQAILAELEALERARVSVDLPSLDGTMNAFRRVMSGLEPSPPSAGIAPEEDSGAPVATAPGSAEAAASADAPGSGGTD